jgi:hypothetical protein
MVRRGYWAHPGAVKRSAECSELRAAGMARPQNTKGYFVWNFASEKHGIGSQLRVLRNWNGSPQQITSSSCRRIRTKDLIPIASGAMTAPLLYILASIAHCTSLRRSAGPRCLSICYGPVASAADGFVTRSANAVEVQRREEILD